MRAERVCNVCGKEYVGHANTCPACFEKAFADKQGISVQELRRNRWLTSAKAKGMNAKEYAAWIRARRLKRVNGSKEEFIKNVWIEKRSHAKKEGWDWNISKPDFLAFCNRAVFCNETGRKVVFKKNDPNTMSIDRIDSSKGYTISNIQIVVKYVNFAKNDLTRRAFHKLCEDVVNHRKNATK